MRIAQDEDDNASLPTQERERPVDRAIRTRFEEEVRHPSTVWTDPIYADEPLDNLREAYLEYLRERATPASRETVTKYNNVLLSFIKSLAVAGEPVTLGSTTPAAVNRWVKGRRERGLAEEGIATHLIALKVFTSKYVCKELELTTVDLLRKVSRITPPERPAQVLTEAEREQLLACFDLPTYGDARNRALVAVYMATGLRFRSVLEMSKDDIDVIRGDVTVITKGGRQQRPGSPSVPSSTSGSICGCARSPTRTSSG
jgi:site-specific recombinase XerD